MITGQTPVPGLQADPMPTTYVLAEHDDGRWYLATVRDQYRSRKGGAWWLVASYYTEPGMQYVRAMPAASCRRLTDQQDDQPG